MLLNKNAAQFVFWGTIGPKIGHVYVSANRMAVSFASLKLIGSHSEANQFEI